MPYMKLNTTHKLTDEQKDILAEKLSNAIENIPGKPAYGVIMHFDDDKTFYLGGVKQDDYVVVNTNVYGKCEFQAKYNFSVDVFKAISEVLGTPKEKMSMTFVEHMGWGGFGDYVEIEEC